MELNFLDFTAATPEPDWLIPGLLPEKALSLVIGDGGSGKTILCLSMALALATGRPFLHPGPTNPSKAHTVWFFDEDGSPPLMRGRIRKLAAGMGIDLPSLYESRRFRVCSSEGYKINGPQFLGRLVTDTKCDYPPDLLIFDALIAFASGNADENSSTDMARVMRDGFRALCTATGCAVTLLHHISKPHEKSASRGALHRSRGSSEIINSTDQVLSYHGQRGQARKLDVIRSRLMAEPDWPEQRKIGLETTAKGWLLKEVEPLKTDKALLAMRTINPNGHQTADKWAVLLAKAGTPFSRSTIYRAMNEL